MWECRQIGNWRKKLKWCSHKSGNAGSHQNLEWQGGVSSHASTESTVKLVSWYWISDFQNYIGTKFRCFKPPNLWSCFCSCSKTIHSSPRYGQVSTKNPFEHHFIHSLYQLELVLQCSPTVTRVQCSVQNIAFHPWLPMGTPLEAWLPEPIAWVLFMIICDITSLSFSLLWDKMVSYLYCVPR